MSRIVAGVARADVTPPIGIAHAGWGAQTHQRARGVDLPLWATALALGDGDQTVVIVDIDIMYLWETEARAVIDAISALTGLSASHIRLSYTHTHSGPISGSTWSSWIAEGAEMVPPYDQSLPHRIAGIVWVAIQSARPARIAAGHGICTINVNRRFQRPEDGAVIVGRFWDGPVDHEVAVLRIDSVEDQPIAAILHYACHPITVGPDCDLVTPDFPGVAKRVVEAATSATCLFLQGAAGDIGPVRGVARGGLHEYKRLGAILGHEASRVWWETATVPRNERYTGTLESGAPLAMYEDEVDDPAMLEATARIRVATHPLRLPLKQFAPLDTLTAAFEEHATRLEELRSTGGDPEAIRWETMLSKRAAMRAALAQQYADQTHLTYELQVFVIGDDIALVAMPGEPFGDIGVTVKERSPFEHTIFSGYSNVGWAYIPTAEAYQLGGYEVEITPFSPDAAHQIVEECLELLWRLHRGEHR